MRINKTASRVTDIFDLIMEKGKPLTITEISTYLDIPKSSAFDILYTLVEKHYLQIDDERLKTFKLGFKIFQSGMGFLSNNSLYKTAHQYLEKMMMESEETVFLAVEENYRLIYLDKVEQPASVRTTVRLGTSKRPMYCSSLGKALLASYSDEKVAEIVGKGELIQFTENTVKDYSQLMSQLKDIRKQGYSTENGEGNPEVACVGAPIYDNTNHSIAAISIASPKYRMNDERFKKFGKLVTEIALSISNSLGFLENKLYF